jgi:hypothetical protein
MALNFTKTRILESIEVPVQNGFTVTAEGQALVADYTGGVFGVKPATGASTDVYYGVSIAQQITLLYLPYFEATTLTIPATAPYTITLTNTPAAGTLRVYNATAGSAITSSTSPPGTGTYYLAGNVLTFNAAQAGANVLISYRYSPTTVQALTFQGDIPPGGATSLYLGTMGVILKGQVATTEFDTTVDWTGVTSPVLKLAANGLYTIGGSGATVPNAVVVQLPSVSDPTLVFEI